MPVWCPKCRGILAEGQRKCPACGARLSGGDEFSFKELAWISGYILKIILIPVLIALGMGLALVILLNS
jgi:hypothetical protein